MFGSILVEGMLFLRFVLFVNTRRVSAMQSATFWVEINVFCEKSITFACYTMTRFLWIITIFGSV